MHFVMIARGFRARTTAALLAAMLLTPTEAAPAERAKSNTVVLSALGHFYVGARSVTITGAPSRPRVARQGLDPLTVDPNGVFTVGATYVSYAKLAHPRHRLPILMLPGGGLSGTVYETTPDGRPGWQWAFLRAGYSTFIADFDETGRSPWARVPEIDPLEPAFRNHAFLWEVFRIGPPNSYSAAGGPRAYSDTLFPVADFTQFAAQAAPRFRLLPEAEAAALDALIQRVCPCILLSHSAPGEGAMRAAQRWPRLVKAVVSVEPSGAPTDVPKGFRTPHLFIWGDHLAPNETDPDWNNEYQASAAYQRRLATAGVVSNEISLPATGVHGNSHMLMMDRNSDAIARLITHWLAKRGS